ncbi:MAG: Fe2+-dependent dioxygenase [Acidiferrobacterales bacterium]
MMLRIPSVLVPSELEAVTGFLAGARFLDGRLSAGAAAKRVKNNEEVDRNSCDLTQLNNLVMGKLVQHPVYRSGAMPLKVAAPYYARYLPGKAYGDHVDDPVMGSEGVLYRSDIAITIFLNAPDQYDGGELVIRTSFGSNAVKLPAGDAIMYPASSIHHVAPVTRGARLVAVTWVQSLVRDPTRREMLYELNQARESLLDKSPDAPETARVNAAYVNLVRMWGEF